MDSQIKIDKRLKKPIYQQIYDWVISGISDGVFGTGYHLPSINQIAIENKLARETVVKAFRLLQEKGIIKAVHGKGFFVTSNNVKTTHRIFLLFDTLRAYKEVLFEGLKNKFGEDTQIDIYFHHFNPKIFNSLIAEAVGNYTAYLVLPFDHPEITEMLNPIPAEKLFLIDRYSRFYKKKFIGVYQDFYNDIIKALNPFITKIKQYKKLVLIFRDTITELPIELLEGFEAFCYHNKINYEVLKSALKKDQIEKNVAYLTIDDNDLVKLVEYSNVLKWKIGKEIGVISYNDTPLKKVVAEGITVISTNFEEMGHLVAQLVIDNKRECIANTGSLIDRGSF